MPTISLSPRFGAGEARDTGEAREALETVYIDDAAGRAGETRVAAVVDIDDLLAAQ